MICWGWLRRQKILEPPRSGRRKRLTWKID
jgi:hypothetical protein